MQRLARLFPLLCALLAGCGLAPQGTFGPDRPDDPYLRSFIAVTDRIEPVAERTCRVLSPRRDCDFLILLDDRPGVPPNAFQTLDATGRPVLILTLPLLQDMANPDELAFVMGHEAAHHVLGHLDRQADNATLGAVLLSNAAQLSGASPRAIREAARIGAQIGARSYSKAFEIEADQLGTVIAAGAGYDPVRGAEFFARLPDPGNRFLGTHPPNAERLAAVRRAAAAISAD